MATCDNCGSHVTAHYKRVFADNQGVLHACSNCQPQTEMLNGAGAGD
ncbi:DUF7563 family protein [Natrinema soli]|uniref:Small CPxCG-related zinc finger protein n=1 Tax=Natrinema soli TaxID=1930624 RepID=A0ABD5SMS4_9EURY|nr:hypothetical protein [Natrinema soli]